MKKIIKIILPNSAQLIIKRLLEFIKYNYRYWKLKFVLLYKKEVKNENPLHRAPFLIKSQHEIENRAHKASFHHL